MLNSVRIRSAITSNCRAPTTPTIHSAPTIGLKTLAPPSSAICCKALPRCLDLSGSSARTLFRSSGAKLGIPVKCSFSAFGQGVADTELSVVGNTDDVTGVGVFCQFAFLCQKHDRGRNFQAFAGADLIQGHAAFEVAGTDTHESNSVTVLGIHVGLNFEDESGYLVFARADGAFGSGLFTRGRRKVMQAFQNFLDTEVVDGAAEENRRKRSGQI